jgi:anti-sigma B factor antagonist
MTEFVTSTASGGRGTLTVSGDVDIATVEELLAEARACLEATAQVCEIDLASVTFMDSSGLGALVRIRNLAREQGKQVVLTNVPERLVRLFEVTGLTDAFGTEADR